MSSDELNFQVQPSESSEHWMTRKDLVRAASGSAALSAAGPLITLQSRLERHELALPTTAGTYSTIDLILDLNWSSEPSYRFPATAIQGVETLGLRAFAFIDG